jgi:hypothetical protein
MVKRTLNVWAGLPIAALMGEQADETRRQVMGWLQGEHEWNADGERCRLDVAQAVVAAQPVGAVFDYLLNEHGEMTADRKAQFKKEIAVLGVGMNTVDLLVIAGGAPVERFTAGANVGVRRLLELANPGGLYSLAEMDDRLRDGTLDTVTALPIWSREVMGLIEETWADKFRRFDAIVCVGGGSILLREAVLRRFGGKAFVADDPVIATARGLYKYALMKSAKNLTPNPSPTGEGRPIDVAFDAGFGSIKVYGKRGGLVMQSAVATNGTRAIGKLTGLRSTKRPLHIEGATGSFYVGQGAHNFGRPVQSLDFDRLTGAPEMIALFEAAMTKYFGSW